MELECHNKCLADRYNHFTCMFAIFIRWVFLSLSSNFDSIRYSAFVNQKWISLAVGAIIVIGLVGVAVVSIVAAFVPSCPYRSSITDAVELLFTTFDWLLKLTR